MEILGIASSIVGILIAAVVFHRADTTPYDETIPTRFGGSLDP